MWKWHDGGGGIAGTRNHAILSKLPAPWRNYSHGGEGKEAQQARRVDNAK